MVVADHVHCRIRRRPYSPDDPQRQFDDGVSGDVLLKLSREAISRAIDYSQINPRILGNIYERFLGYVIEIKERRLDPQAGRDTRRKEGTFYTPQSVTKFLVEHARRPGPGAAARIASRGNWFASIRPAAAGTSWSST